ncbi:HNH endonuclease signature motif containing protein [Cellulomonas sp. PS-H5]|uniref:HNH endonuclease signature motif containing protein n=1 Tax=Cellulomonas sp. PS-H5 TaxID=2820400 RepID=UPI001C4F6FEE|nr:HNH endonuclease signature motif containing protein [Cellulomonas sp. PS-H5]MBW0254294.1 HNH endonuclease [Cellulomonas sp. PS-H5]
MASDLQEHPDGDPVAAVVLPVYGADGTCLTDFGPDAVVAAGGAPRTGEQRQIEAIAACPPGPELDAWLRGLDPSVLPSGVLVEVVAAQTRIESYQHARTLGMIAELASRDEMSPEWSPLAGAPPTQACVAGDELAMRLGWPRVAATKTVHRALVLDGMLGATREALEVGHLDAAKAQVLAAGLADLSFQVAHAVEDAVLPDADQCSVAELRQRVAREIRLVDPEGAASRRERARCTRRVSHPRPQADGMASMWLVLDAADALRVDGVLEHAAKTAKALGDDRTLDQLRADGLRDLVVGDVPESDGPAFEVHLSPGLPVSPEPRRSWNGATMTDRDGVMLTRTVEPNPVATLIPVGGTATDPAPRVGHPAPARGAPGTPTGSPTRTEVEAGTRAGTGAEASHDIHSSTGTGAEDDASVSTGTGTEAGTTTVAAAPSPSRRADAPALATSTHAPAAATATAPVTARRGCTRCSGRPGAEVRITIPASTLLGLDDQPAHLDGHGPIDAVQARALAIGGVWQRVVTDPLTDRVLDVGRECYRPPAALAELVRVRDKTCAAPGCRVPACACELDHTQEFHPQPGGHADAPLGRTDADNLGPVCHRHHRLKTDGGFRLRQIEPGLYEWLTPTGHRYLTRPGTGQTHDATTDPHDAPPPF